MAVKTAAAKASSKTCVLEVKSRPARTGRTPATGGAIQIKASRKIAFRAAKEPKEAV